MRSTVSLTIIAGAFLVLAPYAWAGCTGPNGEAGDTVYAGNFGSLAYCNGTDWISTAGGPTVNIGGNTNNPGGADTQIQFNSGGTAFGGSAGLTWNNSTNTLTATNIGATAVTATTIGGTLSTAAQPNITSVGTLTGLTMGGHINAVGYNVSASNVYASSVSGSSGAFGALTVNGVPVTGNAQGDRISTSNVSSGTTLGMAVADKGTISFTLGGTPGAAYLHPTLGLVGPGVSTTGPVSAASVYTPGNVSASSVNLLLGRFGGQAVGALKGAGGNFITSGTTQVSVSSVGTIKFATSGTLAMTISGSVVDMTSATLAGAPMFPSGMIVAFDLTACPGGWSEYAPARGRFLRGIDNGAGNDPSGTRAPGNYQDDQFKSHAHGPTGNTGQNYFMTNTYPDSGIGALQAGNTGGLIGVAYAMAQTGYAGGPETRPKNVSVLFCRKN